ncbi:MAG: undecaprenyl-diphosphate phosphatase [Blautia sp.]|nr:undecaprenyl-diphosphate phosphatase [Blautia sp.]
MSVLYGILLGIIQGITDFLPVSSFGHLCALESVLGITRNTGVLFEALLHLGTLAAIFFAFGQDIKRIGLELLAMIMELAGNAHLFIHNRRTGDNLHYTKIVSSTYRKFVAMLTVSCIPTALLGYASRRLVAKAAFSPMFPGIGLLITGIILLVTDFSNAGGEKTPREATYDNAMWIGICQGLAVFPGISRLGLTLCAALLCGFSRKFALKYSIMMSIPAVIGAFFMEAGKFLSPGMSLGLGAVYIFSAIVAAVVGCLVIRIMINAVQRMKLRYFAFYCFLAGFVVLAWSIM